MPLQQVSAAREALAHLPRSRLVACSPLYRTKPLGPQDQPDFLNAVVALDTSLPPEQLLDHTQAIERNQGRVRKSSAGATDAGSGYYVVWRSGDKTDRLTIPHYGLKAREFMLYPLADIAPDLIFPDGESLSECLKRVDKNGLVLW